MYGVVGVEGCTALKLAVDLDGMNDVSIYLAQATITRSPMALILVLIAKIWQSKR